MCGIVGFLCRTDRYQGSLGELFVPMLDALATRGPDSAGIAVYSKACRVPVGSTRSERRGLTGSWAEVALAACEQRAARASNCSNAGRDAWW